MNTTLTNEKTELTLDESGSIIGVADAVTGRTYFKAIEADRRRSEERRVGKECRSRGSRCP